MESENSLVKNYSWVVESGSSRETTIIGPQGHVLVGALGNKVLFLGREDKGMGIHG